MVVYVFYNHIMNSIFISNRIQKALFMDFGPYTIHARTITTAYYAVARHGHLSI